MSISAQVERLNSRKDEHGSQGKASAGGAHLEVVMHRQRVCKVRRLGKVSERCDTGEVALAWSREVERNGGDGRKSWCGRVNQELDF